MRIDIRARRFQSRTYHLFLSAGAIATTGMAAPALEAANCSGGKNGSDAGIYSVKRVLPFLGDRSVHVKPVEQKPASPVSDANPSQHPAILSGDPR